MDTPDSTTLKRCTKCGEVKPLGMFSKNRRNRDGLQSECKSCNAKYHREHAEQISAKSRKWYLKNRDRVLERQSNNRDHIHEVAKAYRLRNRDELRARHSDWVRTENGRRRKVINEHNRRARKQLSGGTYTSADIDLIRKGQTDTRGNVRCWYCGKPMQLWHIDHRIPLSRGGSNAPGNLCLACPECNTSKRDKTPSEWNRRLL